MSVSGKEEPKKVGRPRKEKIPVKFVYGVLNMPKDMSLADRTQALNTFGGLGGELVAVVGLYDGSHVAYFMQELK